MSTVQLIAMGNPAVSLLCLSLFGLANRVMGADVCSLTRPKAMLGWVGAPSRNRVWGYYLGEFWKLYMPNRAFWKILNSCDNWSTKWAHFAVLNTDVEAFFFTKQLYNIVKEILT